MKVSKIASPRTTINAETVARRMRPRHDLQRRTGATECCAEHDPEPQANAHAFKRN